MILKAPNCARNGCGHSAHQHELGEFMAPCAVDGCTCPDFEFVNHKETA